MSRFSKAQSILVAVAVLAGLGWSAATVWARQDIPAEVSRAQSLYYSARFQESVELLENLERLFISRYPPEAVSGDPKKADELLQIKLYRGLAFLGLNQTEQAKAKLVEVCLLNRQYTLNPQEFSPKVITLFSEAKGVCGQNQTSAASASSKAGFARGKEFYDRGQFEDALKEFSAVLAVDDKYELAREYSNLAEQRLQLLVRQSYLDWRASFDVRQFDKAKAAYHKMIADGQVGAVQMAAQIEFEYRQILTGLVNSWKAACSAGDRAKVTAIRNEAATIVSGLELGRDALAQMEQCSSRGCIHGDPVLALTRVKTRVNPQIDPSLQRYVSRRTIVSIEIDESGNVTVKNVANANPRVAAAFKEAMERWKFNPVVIDNQTRCVETELPMTLIQPQF